MEVVGEPNGSRIVFPDDPGVSSGQHILTSPVMTHEVVISPGLPTPPLSPFRSARLLSGESKVLYTLKLCLQKDDVERVEFSKQVCPLVEGEGITGSQWHT